MEIPFKLSKDITLNLNRLLCVSAVTDGIQLTHLDGSIETITPVSDEDRNRLFDCWIGVGQGHRNIG